MALEKLQDAATMNEEKRTVKVPGDKVFKFGEWDDDGRCARGTQIENYAHDMDAAVAFDDGPTILYCRRGCGHTQKLEG